MKVQIWRKLLTIGFTSTNVSYTYKCKCEASICYVLCEEYECLKRKCCKECESYIRGFSNRWLK